MKHTDFERKKPVNIRPENPFVIRCNVILLKHAIRKAEDHVLKLIGSRFTLANIEAAIGYIRDAKHAVINTLKNNDLSAYTIETVIHNLDHAMISSDIEPIHEALDIAEDLLGQMPAISYMGKRASDLYNEMTATKFAEDDDFSLDDLVNDAIAADDFAVKSHPADECCPGCGGFMGCACDDMPETWSDATLDHYHTHYKNDTYMTFKLKATAFEREHRDFEGYEAGELLIDAAIEMSAIAVGDKHRDSKISDFRDYLYKNNCSFDIVRAALEHLRNFHPHKGIVGTIFTNGGAK
jgi:hypothetical protein